MKRTKIDLPYPVVVVRATDWAGYDDDIQITDDNAAHCELGDVIVCGMLVHEDKDKIVLVREHYINGPFSLAGISITKKTIKQRMQF